MEDHLIAAPFEVQRVSTKFQINPLQVIYVQHFIAVQRNVEVNVVNWVEGLSAALIKTAAIMCTALKQ